MNIEKQELIESARNLGLEVKDSTPKHIVQRMINKAEANGIESIVVGDVLEKPRDIPAEVNIAFDEKAFAEDEAIRARIRAQLREEDIRKEEIHKLQIERNKLRQLKKYDINYSLEDLKENLDRTNQKYGGTSQIIWDNPLTGFHIVSRGYTSWHPMAQDMAIILRNADAAMRPKNFAKQKQMDNGSNMLISNSLTDLQVAL